MSLTPGHILLGKYRIEKLLGSGGWGDVYLAEDSQLGRQVAIKHLKADWAKDETILQRFLQEARVIAALKHPNVVVIHALEQEGDEHYIIEEYAERGTVGDLLNEQPSLPVEQALDIATAVCRALEAAHLKGIVHRDIKPSNILLCESPEGDLIPKLCDFGIAHVSDTEDKSPITADGDILGTIQYMSPEQLQSGKVDERSDLYSLGTVLYEMLTGQRVLTGSPLDILQAHMSKEPRPPVLERREISIALNDLILRALSKDPADRFQKARHLQEELEKIKAQEIEKQEKAAPLYAQGVAHLQAGEWQQAVQLLSSVVELAPGYQNGEELLEKAKRRERLAELYDLGLAYIRSDAWTEAVETLEAVRRLDEHYRDVAEHLGQAQTQQKLATLYSEGVSAAQARDWATAAAKFGEILQVEKNYRDVTAQLEGAKKKLELAKLYAQGIAHLEQEEWLDAIRCFRDIITEDVTYEDVTGRLKYARQRDELESLYSQGCGYARRSKWPQAIAQFEAVLKVDENYKDTAARLKEARKQGDLEALYNQGMEHFGRGEWDQAVQKFQSVLKTDPQYRDAAARLDEAQGQQKLWQMYCQGKEHFENERWQRAIDLLKQVIERDENYQDAGAMLEEARLQMKLDTLYAQARKHQAAGEWIEADNLYTQIRRMRRGYKDVTQRLAEVEKQEKLAYLYRRAGELLEAEEWSAAVVELRKIQTRDPNYINVAELLKGAKDQERLLVLYSQAEDDLATESWSAAIEKLQEVLAIDTDYRQAAALLRKASYHQGKHYQQERQLEEAIRYFQQAGGYDDAQERLAKTRKQKECRDLFEIAKEHCDKKEWSETQKAIERFEVLEGCEALVKEKELTLMKTYSRSMEHFERGAWWEAIVELRRVNEIDSGYRDVATVLKSAQDSNLLRRNYTLLEEIDTTGTTRVRKARDRNGDLVAIKMLAPSYVVAQEPRPLIEALRRGAELTKELDHPHIVKVRDYEIRGWDEAGKYEDVHIVVMDYVEGENLAIVVNKRKKLRVSEALLIAEQVCEALVHAHSRGVFHGDLKPSNILLSRDRRAKITDFANAPYGTRSFRPPEQARKGGEAIGPRADTYSLGQTICKLITGKAPFRARDAKSPLPRSVARLVEKATRPELEGRYETAQEMLADIRKVKGSLWFHSPVEWLRELKETIVPLLRRWQVFAVLGFIMAVLVPAIITAEPDTPLGKWRDKWFRAQTATPTIVTTTPTAVLTSTPTSTPYPAPVLASPDEGTPFAKGQNVKLAWEWERNLAENEFFEVRIRRKGQQEFDPMTPTKLRYQPVSSSKLTQTGTYEWQVAIVSLSGEEKGASPIWSFEVQ
jgi:serine/threonine protein kinase/outer membrane protein assembly factor BamD (BamD/ComL family)